MKCSFKDCDNDARYKIGLLVRKKADQDSVKTGVKWHLCEQHKDAEMETLLGYHGWDNLCKSFRKRLGWTPEKKHTNIYREEIEEDW